jgi:PEP-CTERM motif
MKRTLPRLPVIALASLLSATAAHATAFQLSFSSAADQSALFGNGEPGFSGSAILTGTELSPGQYNITAATNTTIVDPNFGNQGYAYVPNPLPPLAANSPDGFLTYDGALFAGTPHLSENGLLWVGAVNGADENIFTFNGAYFIVDIFNQANPDNLGNFASVINLTITPVPEPATWVLMVLGFAGLGFIASRRKSKPALMAA